MTQTGATQWNDVSARLVAALKPLARPLAISFRNAKPAARLDRAFPAASDAGRTGAVPAGCVFWILGAERSFSTLPADHGNCSVGSYTHGLITAEVAANRDDVAAILEAGWVDAPSFVALPTLGFRPDHIDYGPLETAKTPDVILLRINGLAAMTLKDAFPDLIVAGKPQCHIIPLAFNEQRAALSTGCALSRARTGMKAEEMTCALPARGAEAMLTVIEETVSLNRAMARYAAEDARRWVS